MATTSATTKFYSTFTISDRKKLTEAQKKANKELLDKKYEEESRLVKGTFKNHESPGCSQPFSLRLFPQQTGIDQWDLMDGKTYEIPLYVANHINKTCNEYEHKNLVDADGNHYTSPLPKRQRFSFVSTDF